MKETLVNYHALSKNISVLRHTRSQGQGQVVDFITFYSTSECFRTLASRVDSMYTLPKISGVELYRRRRIGVTSPFVTMLAHQRLSVLA